ncbi:MAG: putative toxin-antitoxin system toxin component, PIN family [Lachnospiraceae bacterium]|nr:putative toxin-antitoxin system toxin component, PIN family [Lachnospiraceae bacterium]
MRIFSFTNRVVIDTNVIVSALISPNGSSAKFMADVFDQKYEVVITEQILAEYTEVLHRSKFQIDEDIIHFVISWFSSNSLFVEIDESDYPKEEMPDSKDAPFYVAARCTGALLVTKNIKHYPVTEWRTMIWEML